MNIFNELKHEIIAITEKLFEYKVIPSQLSVELPKDPSHGDIATNVAMLISKAINKPPIEIAQTLKSELEKLNQVKSISIAGPGFINIHLKTECWHSILTNIINKKASFGDNNIGNGEKINIEFLSTNPTGPMHIGHSRGGIYGDCLANLMNKCGYKVTKEFYVNDAGSQINALANSAYIRYLEACGEVINSIPEGLYPGEYLIPVGLELFNKYGHDLKTMEESLRLEILKEFTVNSMMQLIKSDLTLLGVTYDVFFSEKTLHEQKKIDEVVNELKEHSIVYEGTLPPPKGKALDNWEAREQLLLRSTDFGDDIDRSLQKPGGEWTYVAADIAYMKNKLERGFNNITMVLGADHLGYKKRMEAIAHALGGDKINFQIKFCQLVHFSHNGKPYKMSKRKGTFITVEDVLEEVNKDLIRFVMLTRRNDQPLDFDLEKVKEQSKDNPVFYVQYANARIHSTLRNAKELNSQYQEKIDDNSYNLELLTRKEELHLIKIMANWPKIVELSCIHQEPHRIAFYLIELASEFHSFWSKGNEDPSLRFIIENNFELTLARLMLAKSVSIVIESGLKIFNVKPIEKM